MDTLASFARIYWIHSAFVYYFFFYSPQREEYRRPGRGFERRVEVRGRRGREEARDETPAGIKPPVCQGQQNFYEMKHGQTQTCTHTLSHTQVETQAETQAGDFINTHILTHFHKTTHCPH